MICTYKIPCQRKGITFVQRLCGEYLTGDIVTVTGANRNMATAVHSSEVLQGEGVL